MTTRDKIHVAGCAKTKYSGVTHVIFDHSCLILCINISCLFQESFDADEETKDNVGVIIGVAVTVPIVLFSSLALAVFFYHRRSECYVD